MDGMQLITTPGEGVGAGGTRAMRQWLKRGAVEGARSEMEQYYRESKVEQVAL